MAGLQKEVWIADIKEKFYPDGSFLNEATDMSAFVDNDKINLAEAGVDPAVLINNTTYPIAINERTDTPHEILLDVWDTENTRLRNAEMVELAYDKRASVVRGHQQSLFSKFAARALHSYAPSVHGANTPVLNRSAEATFKFEDIIDLQTAYNELDVQGERILVLAPKHMASLAKQDLTLYKALMAKPGELLFSFKLYTSTTAPYYIKATGAKKAFGAAATSNDAQASVAWVKSEVMKAMGTVNMFYTLNDPGTRSDIIGFQMRGTALPMRNKFTGAIIQ